MVKQLAQLLKKLPYRKYQRLRTFWWHLKAQPFRYAALGKDVYLGPRVHVMGWRNVQIGEGSQIGHDTIIQANSLDAQLCRMTVGKHCVIAARNFFSIGKAISIGDYTLTAPNCSFLAADHGLNPLALYAKAPVACDGTIDIGVNCFIGTGATVLKNVKIGFGSIVGAGSVVTTSIPPFSLAVGNPARVVRRFHFNSNEWLPVEEFEEQSQTNTPNEAEYRDLINIDAIQHPLQIATSRWADW